MHGRGPGAVDMAKLRVPLVEVERVPVLETDRHPAVLDRRDLGGGAVDEPEPGIVAGQADAVAGAELQPFRAVELDPTRARRGGSPTTSGDPRPRCGAHRPSRRRAACRGGGTPPLRPPGSRRRASSPRWQSCGRVSGPK